MHYHFVRKRVLSGEVELVYVSTDHQTTDIFTKPLRLDKLRHFSSALGLQHLDMPNLRGRKERSGQDRKAESDEEFDFGTVEEAEDGYGGRNQREELDLEPTEPGGGRAAKVGRGSRVKKGKDDQEKAKTKTWPDVVKGPKIEDELETPNSEKRGNESETTDSVEQFGSEESNHLKAKWTKGQQKRCQHRDNEVAGKGHTSRQTDRKGRDMWYRRDQEAMD